MRHGHSHHIGHGCHGGSWSDRAFHHTPDQPRGRGAERDALRELGRLGFDVLATQHEGQAHVVVDGRRMLTPMLLVMVAIGGTDLLFALDSIPAIFGLTTDTFIVLTSNVFAILGLRAMYFLLAGMHARFHLLSYGLALVLVLIGTKMLLIDVYKIPVAWSLGVTGGILAGTMVLSLMIPPKDTAPRGAYPFPSRRRGTDGERAPES